MAIRNTLGKNERLKSRKLIDEIFKSGKKISMHPLLVFYQPLPSVTELKFGAGVSSKNFKKAVDRNRVKRLLRETWRLQKENLQQDVIERKLGLYIFVIYTGKELPEYHTLFSTMKTMIERLTNVIK